MADEPFVMLSLKGDKAKKLAHAITNKSADKILTYLANEKDASESQIAKALKLPVSTVNYTMKVLVDAKLVVAEEYHYSQKGREVSHYSLANQFIIISPNPMWDIKEKLKHILPMTVVAGGVAWLLQQIQKPYYIIKDIIPQAARETVQESVTKAPAAFADAEAETVAIDALTQGIASDAPRMAGEVAPLAQKVALQSAPQEVIKETVTTITHPAPDIVQQAITPDVGLYFFGGFLLAVFLYLIYTYFKSKK